VISGASSAQSAFIRLKYGLWSQCTSYTWFTLGYYSQKGNDVFRGMLLQLKLEDIDVEDMAKQHVRDMVGDRKIGQYNEEKSVDQEHGIHDGGGVREAQKK